MYFISNFLKEWASGNNRLLGFHPSRIMSPITTMSNLHLVHQNMPFMSINMITFIIVNATNDYTM
jgi:hypothetical protein